MPGSARTSRLGWPSCSPPRRPAPADRRGHERDPADGHRAQAAPAPQDLAALTSPSDTKSLIETAVTRFLEGRPALQPLKLVAGLELRGRGDMQHYRVELPGPKVTKVVPSDARVTLEIPRSHFNELATK